MLVAVFCAVGGCWRQPGDQMPGPPPRIAIVSQPPLIELPRVMQGGAVERSADLTNLRDDTIRVADVQISCDCLTVRLPKQEFAPNDKLAARLRLDMRHDFEFQGELRIEVHGFDAAGTEVMRFEVGAIVEPRSDRSPPRPREHQNKQESFGDQ